MRDVSHLLRLLPKCLKKGRAGPGQKPGTTTSLWIYHEDLSHLLPTRWHISWDPIPGILKRDAGCRAPSGMLTVIYFLLFIFKQERAHLKRFSRCRNTDSQNIQICILSRNLTVSLCSESRVALGWGRTVMAGPERSRRRRSSLLSCRCLPILGRLGQPAGPELRAKALRRHAKFSWRFLSSCC